MSTRASEHFGFLRRYSKDLFGGALLILLGMGAVYAGMAYRLGTLSHMGPGFFPVTVGVLLIAVGILIMLASKSPDAAEAAAVRRSLEWRAWALICIGIVAFVVLGRYGGLMPASFAIVFISALGDRDNTWISALILAVAMAAVTAVVFYWLLQLQLPLFTWG